MRVEGALDRALHRQHLGALLALSLGGTVTGEHGVGLLKREGLQREQSAEVLAMQRAVKGALDPHGILNPGKVL